MIHLAVFTEYGCVTDREISCDRYLASALCVASRGKNENMLNRKPTTKVYWAPVIVVAQLCNDIVSNNTCIANDAKMEPRDTLCARNA